MTAGGALSGWDDNIYSGQNPDIVLMSANDAQYAESSERHPPSERPGEAMHRLLHELVHQPLFLSSRTELPQPMHYGIAFLAAAEVTVRDAYQDPPDPPPRVA